MRIISGKFKGLNLHSPKDNEIRPTSDRLMELKLYQEEQVIYF